jgi:hypothetical protein
MITWQDVGQGGDIGSLMVTLEALNSRVKPEQISLSKTIRALSILVCQQQGAHITERQCHHLLHRKTYERYAQPDGSIAP